MLIAERVKTVIPAAPGVRVVGYRCDSRWTPEYVATHDDLLWTAPVVLWSVYVRCFRDEGEYTEAVDIRSVTADMDGMNDSQDSVLGYSHDDETAIFSDPAWIDAARRAIENKLARRCQKGQPVGVFSRIKT